MEDDEEDAKLPTLEELNTSYEILRITEKRLKFGDSEITPSDNIILYLRETEGVMPIQSHDTFDWKSQTGEYKHVLSTPASKIMASELEGNGVKAGHYDDHLGSYIVDEEGMSKLDIPVVSLKGRLYKNETKVTSLSDNSGVQKPSMESKVKLSGGAEEDLSEYDVEKTHRIMEYEGNMKRSYKQKVRIAELRHRATGRKLTLVGRKVAAEGDEYSRAWVITEEGGKKSVHHQTDEVSEGLNGQLDEIDAWHSHALSESGDPEVVAYEKGGKKSMDVYSAVESEKKRVSEYANFLFAYAEKTDNWVRIGNREYSYRELDMYKGLLDFAKIDPKKAKDVKKEVDDTMYA